MRKPRFGKTTIKKAKESARKSRKKKSSHKREDFSQAAARIVREATRGG